MCDDERATASCAPRVTPRRDRILSPSTFGRNSRCQGLGIHGPESIGIIVRIQVFLQDLFPCGIVVVFPKDLRPAMTMVQCMVTPLASS